MPERGSTLANRLQRSAEAAWDVARSVKPNRAMSNYYKGIGEGYRRAAGEAHAIDAALAAADELAEAVEKAPAEGRVRAYLDVYAKARAYRATRERGK